MVPLDSAAWLFPCSSSTTSTATDIYPAIYQQMTFSPSLSTRSTSSSSQRTTPSRESTMQSQASSPGSSTGAPPPARANRACEKCTRAKKKCDKGVPSCSRCTRLVTRCVYDYTLIPPTLSISGDQPSNNNSYATGSSTDLSRFNLLDPSSRVTAEQIHVLLAGHGVGWRDIVTDYFQTTHKRFAIVQTECFDAKLDAHSLVIFQDPPVIPDVADSPSGLALSDSGMGKADAAELATVFACMYLCTQWDETSTNVAGASTSMLTKDLYVSVKRAFSLLKSTAAASVELIQSGVLLAVYEHGHGDVRRAYSTFSEAVAMSRMLGICPGEYEQINEELPISPAEEQLRVLYWAMFVWDKLSHLDPIIMNLPILLPEPPPSALLPLDNYLSGNILNPEQIHRVSMRAPLSASVSTTPLGDFQRSCQAAALVARALEWRASCDGKRGEAPVPAVFSAIDMEAREMVEVMVMQECRAPCSDAIAMCLTLLMLLSSTVLESSNISLTSPDITLKALSTLNFSIRLVLDAYSGVTAGSPPLHPTSAPQQLHAQSGMPTLRLPLPSAVHAVHGATIAAEAFTPVGEAEVAILRGVMASLGRRWGIVRRMQ
ncbi:hypothetical protein jhhlp_007627 [Lomentospora prolificans]|uniref:Zn(2)-C6 fungal-type domain-containing protein n=1 Tax=Lomentospora prolificans TaxID=41688 RepID=A0A2N3N044_9PEZI|nr:hypothetical protein jhhlp_007627 [Lomentospora prolificans]